MFVNRIGRKAPASVSYVLPVTKKDKSTALALDLNRDLEAGPQEPELVLYKQQPDQSWAWEPLRTMNELQTFMTTASTEEREKHLGTWTDSKRYFVCPGDGVIQDNEVTPMGKRWKECFLSKEEGELARRRGEDRAIYSYYSNVVPDKVSLKEKTLATGKVWAFEEPRKYVEIDVEQVTRWKITLQGWKPAATETITYDAESRKNMRNIHP